MKHPARTHGLDLGDLEPAPSQVFGAIRLIPLLRRRVLGDLRLDRRRLRAAITVVGVDGDADDPTTAYVGFIPHALVVSWEPDGRPVAAQGAHLGARHFGGKARHVQLLHRMAKRVDRRRFRFLPQELALEGYLQLHFGGPTVAWSEYSAEALRRGLSPRAERVIPGASIDGLEDALRVFEIHPDQVGVMILVADVLAGVTVFPHPEDYRALHRALLLDFYGDVVLRYGLYHPPADLASEPTTIPRSLDDLRAGLAAERAAWRDHTRLFAAGLVDVPLRWQSVHHAGPFTLRRFLGDLDPGRESHIGEAIVRDDGTFEYLKTFRLGAAQARRAWLLGRLAEGSWSLDACAEAMGIPRAELIERLAHAGFGYLLKPHVLGEAGVR
ncbi:MAG: hypothetical protein R3B09_18920 [Nannocystaceae bacterium]